MVSSNSNNLFETILFRTTNNHSKFRCQFAVWLLLALYVLGFLGGALAVTARAIECLVTSEKLVCRSAFIQLPCERIIAYFIVLASLCFKSGLVAKFVKRMRRHFLSIFEKCRYRMRKNFFICLENCQATAPGFYKNLFVDRALPPKCGDYDLNPFCSIWTRSLKSAFFSMRETYERDMPHFSAISF